MKKTDKEKPRAFFFTPALACVSLSCATLLWASHACSSSIAAEPAALKITSTAFGAGKVIPKQYTGEGQDVSPALNWTAGPEGTTCYALSVEDPDAPRGTWWHWTVINIPAGTTRLYESASKKNMPKGSLEGTNDFGKIGYNGPMPPKGQNHRYRFKVVALSQPLKLNSSFTKEQYEAAIRGHITGQGELVGTYSR